MSSKSDKPKIVDYEVIPNSTKEIQLSVSIDFAQLGVTRIYKGLNTICPDIVGTFKDFPLGTNENLKDTTIVIDIGIEDKNPIVDDTAALVEIKGGKKNIEISRGPVTIDTGGKISYLTVIDFY